MVATPVDALACVLGDVSGSVFSRVAELHIDDERIAGDVQPCFRQITLFDPSPLCQHVDMGMPTIVTASTFDLQEINAALLRLRPQFPAS